MMVVIGLGNPGKQFINTRHNVGREIAEAFARAADFVEFRFEKKWNAQVAEGKIGREKTAVILPDTMMNKSGAAVGAAARFFKTAPRNIFVIHDDADITLGRAKLSFSKRSAGHKGVENVIRALKTKDFWRFRIGIAGPVRSPTSPVRDSISNGINKRIGRRLWRLTSNGAGIRHIPADKLVLKKFTPDEQRTVKKIIKKTFDALHIIAEYSAEKAMNEYNT